MSGKDMLILLLTIYGFKEITIKTYKGYHNEQGYIIDAYNQECDTYYTEENCEGLLFNITHLINYMLEHNINPTYTPFPGYEYTIKEILKKVTNN